MKKEQKNNIPRPRPVSEDNLKLLRELCSESGVDFDTVKNLLDTVRKYAFMERRRGIYEDFIEIINSDLETKT